MTKIIFTATVPSDMPVLRIVAVKDGMAGGLSIPEGDIEVEIKPEPEDQQ